MDSVQECFQSADRALPHKASHTPPFSGIPALLQHLTAAGLKLAVLSSDSLENITAFLEHHRLQSWFQGWMGAESGKPTKPDPLLVHYVCDQIGVTPATTLLVGDAPGDLQMAQAAGMAGAIAATWGWGDRAWPEAQQSVIDSVRLPPATRAMVSVPSLVVEKTPTLLNVDGCLTTLAHTPTEIRVSR
jgi:phosphoglycolate phosphatase